jgi:hypothetical protein
VETSEWVTTLQESDADGTDVLFVPAAGDEPDDVDVGDVVAHPASATTIETDAAARTMRVLAEPNGVFTGSI